MTKEQFKKLMSELISIKKDEDNLSKAFHKFEPDFKYVSFGRYEALVVESLKIAAKDDYHWISYYLYECDCGKRAMEVSTKTKTFKLKTLDQLCWLITNKG